MKRRLFLQGLQQALAVSAASAVWPFPLIAQAQGQSTAMPSGEALLHRFGTPPEPGRLRRVFAAGPPAAVLLAVLASDRMLGWPLKLSEYAQSFLSPLLAGLPVTGRLAGRGSTVSLERLIAYQPDLILDVGTADETYRSAADRIARQTGIPYVLVDGRIGESVAQLQAVGRLLGVNERAAKLSAFAAPLLSEALQRQSQHKDNGPRVYMARGNNGLETGLAGSINVEALEFVGARNVAAAAGRGSLTQVSIEQLLGWDPDFIVTQTPELIAHFQQQPVLRNLRAVREGRLLLAPAEPFGWLDGPPGINRLVGIRWLLTQFYTGERKADFIDQAATFYELFYGTENARQKLKQLPGLAS